MSTEYNYYNVSHIFRTYVLTFRGITFDKFCWKKRNKKKKEEVNNVYEIQDMLMTFWKHFQRHFYSVTIHTYVNIIPLITLYYIASIIYYRYWLMENDCNIIFKFVHFAIILLFDGYNNNNYYTNRFVPSREGNYTHENYINTGRWTI